MSEIAPLSASFAPVFDEGTRVLVLGSLPGAASLAAQEYYANPHNAFWRLLGSVIGRDLASMPYGGRLDAVRAAGIGLWDVVATARRRGSLDAALRDVAANDLATLVASLPELRLIAFNGQKAAAIGQRQLGMTDPDIAPRRLVLPSSSPAHTLGFAAKALAWGELAACLRPAIAA